MSEKVLTEEGFLAPATTSNDDLLDIDEMDVNAEETNDEEEINLSEPDPYLRDMTFFFAKLPRDKILYIIQKLTLIIVFIIHSNRFQRKNTLTSRSRLRNILYPFLRRV